MKKIENIGGYLEIDKDGFIIKSATQEKFQKKWKPVIEEIKQAYIEHFGGDLHSVYIRGSVAKGEAVDNLSDVDTIAIVNLPKDKIDLKWSEKFSTKIDSKYPFVNGVEIVAGTPEDAVSKNRGVHIMLKTQAVCIYGDDISEKIGPLKPGKESAQHFRGIQNELLDTVDFFENGWAENNEEREERCSWIMKRILRTGFELVMEREQKYTRDLYPSYVSFAKHYPSKKYDMYEALELAMNPIHDSRVLVPFLRLWIGWLPGEIERVFNFK
ncbi:MAG: hypothetical protein Q7K40_04245 [bacterium]|nr:hypothetical protein [bacterium]